MGGPGQTGIVCPIRLSKVECVKCIAGWFRLLSRMRNHSTSSICLLYICRPYGQVSGLSGLEYDRQNERPLAAVSAAYGIQGLIFKVFLNVESY